MGSRTFWRQRERERTLSEFFCVFPRPPATALARLEKMRKAIDQQQQHDAKEITVKTSRGEEFKFAGISEKFTKKLYEWETQKGIAPESSTIALLNPNYQQPAAASVSLETTAATGTRKQRRSDQDKQRGECSKGTYGK